MRPPLRVLQVEDSEEDAALVLRELRKSFDPIARRLETRQAMEEALDREPWDVILSDFSMPRFSATEAHTVLREKGLDIPFIIVSGTVGEDIAVQAMRLGVQDYLVKGNLARLCPVVARELGDREVRAAHQRAELGLRESERRYRTLFDASPLPTLMVDDVSGAILTSNAAARARYGYSDEELATHTLDTLVAEPVGPLARHRTKDGRQIVVETHQHAVELEGRRARVVVINDVTERMRAEEELRATEVQLRHLQKMEAVNRLAGGIAHDFNNILSAIISYVTLGMDDLPADSPVREDLAEALVASRRASDLTRQLLAFSRQQVLKPQVIELESSVADMDSMLRRLIGEDVDLVLEAQARGARIYADPGQIEQVVMNLVINARDAMPEGGTITVQVDQCQLDATYAKEHPGVLSGPHVRLSVRDTGVGMDAAVQARIFEPFFTTKGLGKGTGLGLAMVYGIVTQSQGHLVVHSVVGHGSTFEAYFPLTTQEPLQVPTASRPSLTPRGTETVLVVEDDAQVRASMCAILERQGYQVLRAVNGAEGLDLVQRTQGTIHLLITDIVMPRMSGRELVDKVVIERPDVRILYVSGYAESASRTLPTEHAFLAKPIVPQVLVERVRALLDAAPRVSLPSP